MSKETVRYCWGCERVHTAVFITFPSDEATSATWVQKWNETFSSNRKRADNIRICDRWYVVGSGETKKGQKRTKIPTFKQGMDGKAMDKEIGAERDVRKKELDERRRANEHLLQQQRIDRAKAESEYHKQQHEAAQRKLQILSPAPAPVRPASIARTPSMDRPLMPAPVVLEANNRLAHYFYVDNLEVVNNITEAIRVESNYKGKKIELDRMILLTLWRLTEAKQFTELSDGEDLDRTNISRNIHKILPSLAKHVYEEYTPRVIFPTTRPSNSGSSTNTNDNARQLELDMDIDAEDIPNPIKMPPICAYYMRGTNYFLDDSTYVYLADVPHNFDTNRLLWDSHKECHTIRFYNVCHPTGHHICFFGPNDAQAEDYIVSKFYDESPYFRSVVDNLKCKISDRGFNRVIEARDWNRNVGLTVHCAADASDSPWRVDQREQNQLYSAMRAPVEQRHAPLRQFDLLNEFPIEEIKYVREWYQLAVGLTNMKVTRSFCNMNEVDEMAILRTLRGESVQLVMSLPLAPPPLIDWYVPALFIWNWPLSYLAPEAAPATLEDISNNRIPPPTPQVSIHTLIQEAIGNAIISEAALSRLTLEPLKEICRRANLGQSGRKNEIVQRIWQASLTPPRPTLRMPSWTAPRIPPPSIYLRSQLHHTPKSQFRQLTANHAHILPNFTYDNLVYLLRTPTTSVHLPMYSKSLIRAEDHANDFSVDLKQLSYFNKVIVYNSVHSSMKKTSQSVYLFYTLPQFAPVTLDYWNSNNLTRYCTCLNGLSGNCSHIAVTLRHVAILQGMIQPHRKYYAAIVEDTINIRGD